MSLVLCLLYLPILITVIVRVYLNVMGLAHCVLHDASVSWCPWLLIAEKQFLFPQLSLGLLIQFGLAGPISLRWYDFLGLWGKSGFGWKPTIRYYILHVLSSAHCIL
jgi:hypothetical protein